MGFWSVRHPGIIGSLYRNKGDCDIGRCGVLVTQAPRFPRREVMILVGAAPRSYRPAVFKKKMEIEISIVEAPMSRRPRVLQHGLGLRPNRHPCRVAPPCFPQMGRDFGRCGKHIALAPVFQKGGLRRGTLFAPVPVSQEGGWDIGRCGTLVLSAPCVPIGDVISACAAPWSHRPPVSQ